MEYERYKHKTLDERVAERIPNPPFGFNSKAIQMAEGKANVNGTPTKKKKDKEERMGWDARKLKSHPKHPNITRYVPKLINVEKSREGNILVGSSGRSEADSRQLGTAKRTTFGQGNPPASIFGAVRIIIIV